MRYKRHFLMIYIVRGKYIEYKSFHEETQCAVVCLVDCCVPDDNHVESEEKFLSSQAFFIMNKKNPEVINFRIFFAFRI